MARGGGRRRRTVDEDGGDEEAAHHLQPVGALLERVLRVRAAGQQLVRLLVVDDELLVREEDEQPAHDRRRLEHELPVRLLLVHERVEHAPAEQHVAAGDGARAGVARQHDEQAADELHADRQDGQRRLQRGVLPARDPHGLLLHAEREDHAERVLDERRDDQDLGDRAQAVVHLLEAHAGVHRARDAGEDVHESSARTQFPRRG